MPVYRKLGDNLLSLMDGKHVKYGPKSQIVLHVIPTGKDQKEIPKLSDKQRAKWIKSFRRFLFDKPWQLEFAYNEEWIQFEIQNPEVEPNA